MSAAARQSTFGQSGSSRMRARDSMFPVPDTSYLSSLEECVKATEGCVEKLDSALAQFGPAVQDFPRLKKLFTIQQHNIVLPEPVVTRKKAEYAAGLQPYIDQLLDRAAELVARESNEVARLEEHLAHLQNARANRIPAAPRLPGTFKDLDVDETRPRLDGIDMRSKDVTLAQRRRIGALKLKRDKLEKERARLLS